MFTRVGAMRQEVIMHVTPPTLSSAELLPSRQRQRQRELTALEIASCVIKGCAIGAFCWIMAEAVCIVFRDHQRAVQEWEARNAGPGEAPEWLQDAADRGPGYGETP
jgi:hypothetical protein